MHDEGAAGMTPTTPFFLAKPAKGTVPFAGFAG